LRRRVCAGWIAAMGILACGASAVAQRPLLADSTLARRLERHVTVSWRDQPVGDALTRLGALYELPLWIDRRVDTNHEIQLSVQNQPLHVVLTRLASDEDRPWGWSTLRTIVYFGPQAGADELATTSEVARQMLATAPAGVRRAWVAPKPWSIPRLAEPRMLLSQTVDEIGVESRDVDVVPHDVWPAREYTAVAPVDRLVLTLIGFDLTARPASDGRQLEVAPLDRPMVMMQEYRLSKSLEEIAARLAAEGETIQLQREGSRLVVAAHWEIHQQLKSAGRRRSHSTEGASESPRRRARGEEQRFTLRIQNQPVGRVIAQLAAQLQLTVAWTPQLDDAPSPVQDRLVSCDVHDATLDELLGAILSPAGLAFDRADDLITIRAAP
jgi:hypothetical protein